MFFDLDFDLKDLVPFLGDGKPLNVARLRLETLEAIDGDFNIEIEATAALDVSCTFPGGCTKGKYIDTGKKYKPSGRRKGTDVQVRYE